MRFLGPPDSWYQPPDPPEPCCALAEDDESHDQQACVDEQAEAAAEARAERERGEIRAEMKWWDEMLHG